MTALATRNTFVLSEVIEQVLMEGDLARLTSPQRLSYYKKVCESIGLNPLTKPFDYLSLNNKVVLYAKKDATDQLRAIHKVSIRITAREKIGDVYVVTAQASSDGREDEATGAIAITPDLKGDKLANAYMKAETKAKRRVTLSICGLGLLDEHEVESLESLKQARRISDEELDALSKSPDKTGVSTNVFSQIPEFRFTFGPYNKKTPDEAIQEFGVKHMIEHVEETERRAKVKKSTSPEVTEYVRTLREVLANAGAIDAVEDNIPF